MFNKKQIKQIIKDKFNSPVLSIKDLSKGWDHKVYMIKIPKKEVVLRAPIKLKEKNKLFAQCWAFRQWRKLKLPFPEVLFIEKDYLIEEKVEGVDMVDANLSIRQQQAIMYELGKIVKKMHTVKTKGYGYLNSKGTGEKKSWREYIEPDFKGNFNQIKKARLISSDLANKIEAFFEERKDILNYKDSRLLHQDLTDDNIKIKDGKITGIIDASDAASGDPMQDIAVINQHYFGRNLMNHFLKGYGKVDMRKLNFYSLYLTVWLTNLTGLIKPDKKALAINIKKLEYYLSCPGE